MIVNSSASGLAYLWETTPVLGMEALPIYGFGHNEDYKLPGAPWCYDLIENKFREQVGIGLDSVFHLLCIKVSVVQN